MPEQLSEPGQSASLSVPVEAVSPVPTMSELRQQSQQISEQGLEQNVEKAHAEAIAGDPYETSASNARAALQRGEISQRLADRIIQNAEKKADRTERRAGREYEKFEEKTDDRAAKMVERLNIHLTSSMSEYTAAVLYRGTYTEEAARSEEKARALLGISEDTPKNSEAWEDRPRQGWGWEKGEDGDSVRQAETNSGATILEELSRDPKTDKPKLTISAWKTRRS